MPDADPLLLERLRQWRGAQAREQSVPAYVIFHDRTLAAIAAARPSDLEELAGIHGSDGCHLGGARPREQPPNSLCAVVRRISNDLEVPTQFVRSVGPVLELIARKMRRASE